MNEILDVSKNLSDYAIGHVGVTIIFVAFKAEETTPNASDSQLNSSASFAQGSSLLGVQGLYIYSEDLSLSVPLVVRANTTVGRLKKLYIDYIQAGETQAQIKSSNSSQAVVQGLQPRTISFKYEKRQLSDTDCLKDFLSGVMVTLDVVVGDGDKKLQVAANAFETFRYTKEFRVALQKISSSRKVQNEERKSRIFHYHTLEHLQREQISNDLQEATAFTAELLKKKPNGTLESDPILVPHILSALCRQCKAQVLFYDSKKGMKVLDSSAKIDDMLSFGEKSMVLQLNFLEGLFGFLKQGTEGDTQTAMEMQASIECGVPHPTLEDVRQRLARSLEVEKERIAFKNIFVGSVWFEFTVSDLSQRERESILQRDTNGRLRQEFDCFLRLRLHPLLFRPAFDLAMFDVRGNKSFLNEGKSYLVGPQDQKKLYQQPRGWERFGLNVLTGDPAGDKWLHPFQDPGNWWRAFHGTSNAGVFVSGVNRNNPVQMADASVRAAGDIYRNGFHTAQNHAYGPGVYCTPY